MHWKRRSSFAAGPSHDGEVCAARRGNRHHRAGSGKGRPDSPRRPICLQSLSPERLILIGEALAKSVVLARHEREVASVFDTTEPFARELARSGRMRGSRRSILKNIGNALLVRHRVSGPVEVEEKPDVLWDKRIWSGCMPGWRTSMNSRSARNR
jgi:hypothetical protein